MVDIIIPTKSYMFGLGRIIGQLINDPGVGKIVVVADGDEAYQRLMHANLGSRITILKVELGDGIHVMWNLGIEECISGGNHLAFVNDDVTIGPHCFQIISDLLDRRQDIGLVTPNYTDRNIPEFKEMVKHGGFCMTLAKDLCQEWRFDERMKWWYGDDDIQQWTHRAKNRRVGLTGLATCGENCSYTISQDGPINFAELVENDRKLFVEKWG